MSGRFSNLMPIYVAETLPGDSFRLRTDVFMRVAPMSAPILHAVNVDVEYFFVPNRLVYKAWEDFITGGPDGTLTPEMSHIRIPTQNTPFLDYFQKGTLWDYMGLPPIGSTPASDTTYTTGVNLLPFKAYQLIYNTYYRDQTLTPEVDIMADSEGNHSLDSTTINLLTLRKRSWEKDYFTSALPWAQRGNEVTLPLHGDAPIYHTDYPTFTGGGQFVADSWGVAYTGGVALPSQSQNAVISTAPASGGLYRLGKVAEDGYLDLMKLVPPKGQLKADMTSVASTTVNELRRSIRLQQWLENNARAGARYIEQIWAHFRVRSSDARLQRPEFIGGQRSPVVISEVLQQSSTGGEPTPAGTMFGHGITAGVGRRLKFRCEEHGYIIGIMSVLPRTAYSQGMPRHFMKSDKFDYAFPEFANIGEQAIYQGEVVYQSQFQPGHERNKATFGYTPRYAEYKHHLSRVAGDMRDTLNFWHLGRELPPGMTPLNAAFVEAEEIDRIFAEREGDDYLFFLINNSITAKRPLPYFGTPSL